MSLYSELAASLLKTFHNVALGKILRVTLRIKDNLARKYSISTEIHVPFLPALPFFLEGERQRLVRRERERRILQGELSCQHCLS